MKARKIIALLAVAGIALAACGGDDDDDSGASATTAASGATTPAAATPRRRAATRRRAAAIARRRRHDTTATTAAAGGTATTAAAAEPAAPITDVNIGLVTDTGKVDDKSFNQSAWEGAQAAAEATGGKAEYIETVSTTDYASNIDQFVNSGANIIVTVGFGMAEATAAAAAANPDIRFIGVDQFQAATVPNVTGLVFNEDKSGYLAGALAGLLSTTGTVAAVLGTDQVPPVVAFKTGFENGAKCIKAGTKVIATYNPGGLDTAFNDPGVGGHDGPPGDRQRR